VNTDGTLRRIANWKILTQSEKEATLRRINKRNQERIKDLERREQQNVEL